MTIYKKIGITNIVKAVEVFKSRDLKFKIRG